MYKLRSSSSTRARKYRHSLKKDNECRVKRTVVLDAITELENEDLERNVRALSKCLEKAGALEKRAFEQLPPEFRRLLAKDVFDTEVRKKIEESEAYKGLSKLRKAEFGNLTEIHQQKLAELQELQQKLEAEQKQLDIIKREMYAPDDNDLLFVKQSGEDVEDENMPSPDNFKVPQSFAFDCKFIRPNSAN